MQPDLILTPFGDDATPGTIDSIPESRGPSDPPQKATWTAGFPLVTMTPLPAGGIPPRGQDINGVLKAISEHTVFVGGGGQYKWSDEYAAKNGGYSKGNVLQSDDGASSFVSLVDSNAENFNTSPSSIGTKWAPYSGSAAIPKQATEAVSGIAQIATSSQATAGTDDSKIMTPKKVKDAISQTVGQATTAKAGIAKISTQQQAVEGVDDTSIITPLKLKDSVLSAIGFTPVQQGGGIGQGNSKLKLGIDSNNKLRLTADGVDFGAFVLESALTAFLPKRSFAGSDYIRIPDVPGGLIIQWAEGSIFSLSAGSISSQIVGLPAAFPNSILKSFVTTKHISGVTTVCAEAESGTTNSSVSVKIQNPVTTGSGSGLPKVISIGF